MSIAFVVPNATKQMNIPSGRPHQAAPANAFRNYLRLVWTVPADQRHEILKRFAEEAALEDHRTQQVPGR